MPSPVFGLTVDIVGGALVAAVGLFIASVRPRKAENLAFAGFCLVFGANFVFGNLLFLLPAGHPVRASAWTSWALAAIAGATAVLFFAVVTRSPRRIGRDGAGVVAATVLVALLLATPATVLLARDTAGYAALYGVSDTFAAGVLPFFVYNSAYFLLLATLAAGLLLLAVRFRSEPDAAGRRQAALMSGAVALFVGQQFGVAVLSPSTADRAMGLLGGASLLVLSVLWLRNTDRPESRAPRNVALLAPAALAFGMLMVPLAGSYEEALYTGGGGIARTVGVLILATAILRNQFLDIDVKMRWTITRGTVALAFVAVFFVVAQIAQTFLSETYGLVVGGTAAGLLLFAIAPLQRLAERVAARAVPVVGHAPPPSPEESDRRLRVYRRAVRHALRDGLTPEEETHLAELATELGIDYATALAVRREVEAAHGLP